MKNLQQFLSDGKLQKKMEMIYVNKEYEIIACWGSSYSIHLFMCI